MRVILLSSFLVLTLTACQMVEGPTFMPSGYTHHHNASNSPPGPEAWPEIGYEYTAEKNDAAVLKWRHAVQDLVLKARANDVQIPMRVRLLSDDIPSAFTSSFDHSLREVLNEYDHVLVPAHDMSAAALYYKAEPIEGSDAFLLSLMLDESTYVSGGYEVPVYGYVHPKDTYTYERTADHSKE